MTLFANPHDTWEASDFIKKKLIWMSIVHRVCSALQKKLRAKGVYGFQKINTIFHASGVCLITPAVQIVSFTWTGSPKEICCHGNKVTRWLTAMIIIHQCYCSSLPAVNSNQHDTAEHFHSVADTVWHFQT